MIKKIKRGYKLVSHKGRNLGIFKTKKAALKHEREVIFFKYAGKYSLKLKNRKR